MTVDLFASQPHYWEHLRPIWEALPRELRGTAWSARNGQPWGVGPFRRSRGDSGASHVLVAGAADRGRVPAKPILVEHGAGQSYVREGAGHPSYAGGKGWGNAGGFISPGPAAGNAWRAAYPGLPVFEVGCPKMDTVRRTAAIRSTVAMAWHWDCRLCPETRWAWPHYVSGVLDLARWCETNGVDLVGHAHPRVAPYMRKVYERYGIRWVNDVWSADVLIVDNSSIAYEAASLGIPVVMANAPWYRRDVDHGLRFWDRQPGFPIDEPSELVDAVAALLAGWQSSTAVDAVAAAYSHVDGHATERAVAAIRSIINA